jgi:hypothetical protein
MPVFFRPMKNQFYLGKGVAMKINDLKQNSSIYNNSMYLDFDISADVQVGDCKLFGEPNRYDLLAIKNNFEFYSRMDVIAPIKLGYTMVIIVNVEKKYRPKNRSGSHSWLTNGDYSNNPNFEAFWNVAIEEESIYWELADFLELK